MSAILVDGLRELTLPEELDLVSGGLAAVSAQVVGDAVVNGSLHLDNLPGVFSIADISASMQVFSGTPTLTLMAHADTLS
jgi:hypothetical protein